MVHVLRKITIPFMVVLFFNCYSQDNQWRTVTSERHDEAKATYNNTPRIDAEYQCDTPKEMIVRLTRLKVSGSNDVSDILIFKYDKENESVQSAINFRFYDSEGDIYEIKSTTMYSAVDGMVNIGHDPRVISAFKKYQKVELEIENTKYIVSLNRFTYCYNKSKNW